MKKLKLLSLLFYVVLNSQDVQKVEVVKNDNQIEDFFNQIGDNEINIDVFDLLAMPAFDISYEKILDPYSSYGLSLFINASDANNSSTNWTDIISLTPYYRFYFFNKRDFGGNGFFAEVFSKISRGKHDVEYYYGFSQPDNPNPYEYKEEKFLDLALGAGIGQKWVNKKGWTFQIMIGIGRYLFVKDSSNSNQLGSPEIYSSRPKATGRGGVTIGKRF